MNTTGGPDDEDPELGKFRDRVYRHSGQGIRLGPIDWSETTMFPPEPPTPPERRVQAWTVTFTDGESRMIEADEIGALPPMHLGFNLRGQIVAIFLIPSVLSAVVEFDSDQFDNITNPPTK